MAICLLLRHRVLKMSAVLAVMAAVMAAVMVSALVVVVVRLVPMLHPLTVATSPLALAQTPLSA